MDRRAWLAAAALLAMRPALAHHAEFRTLRPGDFNTLVAARRGKAFLLVFWSLAGDVSQADLGLLAELRAAHPAMPLVLVCVDGVALQGPAGKALIARGIEHESIWIFVNRNNATLRAEVDPAWDGGVPRSYLYGADGARETLAGALDRARIESWLATLGG